MKKFNTISYRHSSPSPFVKGGIGLCQNRHNVRNAKNYLKWGGMSKKGVIKRDVMGNV